MNTGFDTPLSGLSPAGSASLAHQVMDRIAYRAIILGLALLPFMMWRFHPDIQFTLGDGCFAVGLVFALMSGRLNLNPFAGLTAWWILAFCLMLLALGVSSLVNGDPLRFAVVGSQYLFAYLVLPYFIFGRSRAELWRFITISVGIVVLAELFSIVMYYLYGDVPFGLAWINHNFVTGAQRLGSFFGSANRNAAVISLALPFVLFFIRTGYWPLWIGLIGAAILGLALILTASVTGLISSSVALLVFVVAAYGWRAWKPMAAGAALLLVAFAAGFTLPQSFEERVLGAVESGDISSAGTYSGRMDLIEEALEISDDTNILGLGADQFRAVSDGEAPVHNAFLLIWTEGGLFALLGWCFALGLFAFVAVKAFAADRTAGALALSIGFVFVIVASASTHMYARLWVVPLLFAMRIGILALVRR
ncbi:O-antigen ligase family protein [Qipengyuania zhejiangensis]|uniref:O-antigen ligase family protein n=1 Tax=Qipengyuania zhejiangensis TaxID=3077782 RepID=UPI002D767C9B|nr:O-antigen ligase family protein [Qipengyuania sp. Z2]